MGKSISRYPWTIAPFYADSLRSLLNRAYNSLEWCLNSPPKPHAFVSLPIQSNILKHLSGKINSILASNSFKKVYKIIITSFFIFLLRFLFLHFNLDTFLSLYFIILCGVIREIVNTLIDSFNGPNPGFNINQKMPIYGIKKEIDTKVNVIEKIKEGTILKMDREKVNRFQTIEPIGQPEIS